MRKHLCIAALLLLLLLQRDFYSEAFVVAVGRGDVQAGPKTILRSQIEDSQARSSSSSADAVSKSCGCNDETATTTTTTSSTKDAANRSADSIPKPFLPAMDPKYPCRGPVGEGTFVITRTGGPTQEELSNENMLRIVQLESTDLEVNTLVWKCLGYRFDVENETWRNDEVFPNWRGNYPTPPDLIGMQRVYSKQVDEPCLRSNQSLVRSIPLEHKQSLKPALKPLGWTGYQFVGLTPNKTRRAQCANWLIYYRDHMFGYTLDELKERRLERQKKAAELEKNNNSGGGGEEDFKPPVKEVF